MNDYEKEVESLQNHPEYNRVRVGLHVEVEWDYWVVECKKCGYQYKYNKDFVDPPEYMNEKEKKSHRDHVLTCTDCNLEFARNRLKPQIMERLVEMGMTWDEWRAKGKPSLLTDKEAEKIKALVEKYPIIGNPSGTVSIKEVK